MKIERRYIDILVSAIIIIVSVVALWYIPAPKEKIYNCSISEISPDYPLQVKEACRKLRANKT